MKILNRNKSHDAWEKLQTLLPGGVSSPVRACRQVGVTPLIADRGEDCRIIDIDGNAYIDFCMSWGALLFGHAHPIILDAARMALNKGTTYGITTVQEGVLGERIMSLMPSIERVRFVSSGTEAVMSAVRLARARTGKNRILAFEGHYHGHHDQFLKAAGSGALYTNNAHNGVPESFASLTDRIPFNDFEAINRYFESPYGRDCAAILLEPVAINMGCVLPKEGFLEFLRAKTREYQSLLIFDEVVTGFRLAPGGAQEFFKITPDLTCLGKIVGGGFPLAAFGGKKEIMNLLAPEGHVYQAGTLSGNPIAVEAAIAVLDMIGPEVYEELQRKSDRLFKPIEQLIVDRNYPVQIQRIGSIATLFFSVERVSAFHEALYSSQDRFREFFKKMLGRGVYIPPLQFETLFLSMVHSDKTLDNVSEAMCEVLSEMFDSSEAAGAHFLSEQSSSREKSSS